jgi:anti-anti-sigma regulatory factor
MPHIRGIYSYSETNDFVLVRIGDELTSEAWSRVTSLLDELIGRLVRLKSRAILVDLSMLNNTSSAVVAAVVRIWRRISEIDGRVIVLTSSAEAQSTFALAGLATKITFVEDLGEAYHRLGLSRTARMTRRETSLLKLISPTAAATAVAALVVILLSWCPVLYQPSVLFSFFVSVLLACGGGWITAAREAGKVRFVSQLASATGMVTLIAAIGHWTF